MKRFRSLTCKPKTESILVSLYIYLYLYLSIHLSICLSIYLSIHICVLDCPVCADLVYAGVTHRARTVHDHAFVTCKPRPASRLLSIHLYLYLPIYLSIYLSVFLSIYLSIYVYLTVLYVPIWCTRVSRTARAPSTTTRLSPGVALRGYFPSYSAHIRQSQLDDGFEFQLKVFTREIRHV